jgi:hypothetical protein
MHKKLLDFRICTANAKDTTKKKRLDVNRFISHALNFLEKLF